MPAPLTRPSVSAPQRVRRLAELLGGELRGIRADLAVTGISLDSRRVQPGDLYAAVPGSTVHGADFATSALDDGAVAVLTDSAGLERLGTDMPAWIVERPRSVLGAVAAEVYGQPANRLRTVGVTGTHGKTTTCFMLEAGIRGTGEKPALIGTIGTRIGGEYVKTALTTPEAPDLHALFAIMLERSVDVCAMEVSSHALVMGRVDGVVFDLAVFTNLGRDHLDFHTDLEDYFGAKADLFTPQRARRGLVNVDDEHGRRLAKDARIAITTFSPGGGEADWRAEDVVLRPDGSELVVVAPDGSRHPLALAVPGRFNVANALAAVAALGESGLDVAGVTTGLAGLSGVPGRLESLPSDLGFSTVVDYAHKPDALAEVLAALRRVTTGRLITVVGAGGDRDRGKRPLMGEIAARLSDVVVVTDDNPRGEEPAAIRADVVAGAVRVPVAERAELVDIGDRGRAIATAIGRAAAGDCVLIAGKGHEQGQEVSGVVHPFDDRDVARAAIARLGEPGGREDQP